MTKDFLYTTLRYVTTADENSTMTFGQYKGKAFENVPQDYLDWVMAEHDRPKPCSPEFTRVALWALLQRQQRASRGYGQSYVDPEASASVPPPPPVYVGPRETPRVKLVKDLPETPPTRKTRGRVMDPPTDFAMVSSAEDVMSTKDQIEDLEARLAKLKEIKEMEESKYQGGNRSSGGSGNQ